MITPDVVLAHASEGETPQARMSRNPYLTAAIIAYDKLRFDREFIDLIALMLHGMACERHAAGKATHRDHLLQEALKIGKRFLHQPS